VELVDIHTGRSSEAPEIARFRAANAAVETRLQMKLPVRMTEFDAIYDLALLPEYRGSRRESGGLRQDLPRPRSAKICR
jgi:hypothetical protein